MARPIHCLMLTLLALSLWVMGACAATQEAECRSGAECASGACTVDGTCVDAADGGGPGSGGDGGAMPSGGEAPSGGSGGSGACLPNEDGVIEQREVPIMAGLSAKQLTTQGVTFATAGIDQGDGSRAWDFTAPLAGDHLSIVETQPLGWFANAFPGATYASRLSDTSDLLGVFEVASGALLLRGVVSPSDGIGRTELSYEPAVVVLSFPLSEGKTWSTTSTVTGLAEGIAVLYTEQYDYEVDANGSALTPYAEFVVLRVHSQLERTIGLLTTTNQSFVFVTECFGTVASIASQDNELSKEFTNVAEIRRLSP